MKPDLYKQTMHVNNSLVLYNLKAPSHAASFMNSTEINAIGLDPGDANLNSESYRRQTGKCFSVRGGRTGKNKRLHSAFMICAVNECRSFTAGVGYPDSIDSARGITLGPNLVYSCPEK